MATLKLKSDKTPAATDIASSKTPVRRADPSKRSRTQVPAKFKASPPAEATVPATVTEQAAPRSRPEKPREHTAKPAQVSKPSQRNHRYDGTLRDADTRQKRVQDETGRDTPRRGGKARDGFEAGEFNRDRTSNPKFSAKPVASSPDTPRLSKRMAELGLCSRREADEWIVNGWVRVDGVVVDELGSRVSPTAKIEVSKEAEKHQAEIVTILLHKPVGYVSGQAEDGYEPASVLVKPENHWDEDPSNKPFKRGHLKGLAPAGRLDIDSTGLLVLTQDGRVARQLIGEDSTIEKEYLVRVEGELSDEGFALLNFGLSLDGVKLKPAKVSWQNEDQLRFVLREGRKRQIRRMCELVGLHVTGLKRVRIGSVTLGKLPVGAWRYLRQNERF